MRVLQINSVCGIGSTGRIVVDLYKVLQEHGHECLIAYGRGRAPEDINSYRIGTDFDVITHGILTRITDRAGFYSTRATNRLVERIVEYDPDVIHLHNLHGYYLHVEVLFDYLKHSGKPVVWTLHDCWPFTGHCAYFDYVGCMKWKDGCGRCPQKKSYPASYVQDNSRSNHDSKRRAFTSLENLTIVTPSRWLGGLVKQSFLKKYPTKVINNGIDLSVFRPRESAFREKYGLMNKIIVLGVANVWDKRKGLDTFIRLSEVLDRKYTIVLVGLTKKQLKSLPPNVLGLEKTDNVEQLVEIYSAADIFVNPTLEDNFPTVNIEALACGTPVVTYDTGGCGEIIDESCGAVVPRGNMKVLLPAITGKKVKESNCLKKAKEFSGSTQYKRYYRLYRRLGDDSKILSRKESYR